MSNPLRVAAMAGALVGAAGSLGFMLRVGRANPSRILIGLFAIWVLSPFVALVLANTASKRWTVPARTTLYCIMLIVALGCLTAYGVVVLGPPMAKPASVFLVVPGVSWLLIAVAQVMSRR